MLIELDKKWPVVTYKDVQCIKLDGISYMDTTPFEKDVIDWSLSYWINCNNSSKPVQVFNTKTESEYYSKYTDKFYSYVYPGYSQNVINSYDKWLFVCIRQDTTNSKTYMYLDGQQRILDTSTLRSFDSNYYKINKGGFIRIGEGFTGYISKLNFYDRVISDEELQELIKEF